MINKQIFSKNPTNNNVYFTVLTSNLALAFLKLSLGVIGYSKLILMDGIFSFSNAVVLLLMWQGDKLERKGPDEKHPYGYGKILFVVASFSGFIVLIISIYMLFYSINEMSWVEIHRSHSGAMMATVISIFGNEVLYRYMREEGLRSTNNVLLWNSVNNRINVFISSVILFCIILSSLGVSAVEKIGVGLVSFIIFCVSLRILLKSFAGIMDKVPPKEVLNKIKSVCKKVSGVTGVLDIKARYVGTLLFVDVHIVVNETLTMKEADIIAHDVESLLIKKIPMLKEINAIIN